jgi:hypothetical protein
MIDHDPTDDGADAEITRLYGDKSVEEMRQVYGEEFAKSFEPLNKLSDVLSETGEKCLEWLQRVALRNDHKDGTLKDKLDDTTT